MEAQMQHNNVLHRKSISDRERHSASLVMQMAKKAKMNTQLQEQVMSLADLMDDQVPVMESVLTKRNPDRFVVIDLLAQVQVACSLVRHLSAGEQRAYQRRQSLKTS